MKQMPKFWIFWKQYHVLRYFHRSRGKQEVSLGDLLTTESVIQMNALALCLEKKKVDHTIIPDGKYDTTWVK